MSIRKMVEIVCDECSDTAEDDWALTATDARKQARDSDWHTSLPGGRDLCPDCWKKGRR